jgi:hypothetical protein
MSDAAAWKVDAVKGNLTKNAGITNDGAVTALKVLRGVCSVLYWLAVLSKWVAIGGMIFAGGLLALLALGISFTAGVTIALFLGPLLPILAWGCALSPLLAFLFDFSLHRADQSILSRELPKNLPIDIWQTFQGTGDMRDKLRTIIPNGFSLGGTRKFSLEIASDIELPFTNNVAYPPKIHLAEVLKESKIVGYVARGKDSKTYHYIKQESIAENFWKRDSWLQFTTSAEFTSAIGNVASS